MQRIYALTLRLPTAIHDTLADVRTQGNASPDPFSTVPRIPHFLNHHGTVPKIVKAMMAVRIALTFAFRVASWLFSPRITLLAAAAVFVPTVQAHAQQTLPPVGRVIVIGEGSVSVTPDYAQIGSGVTTRAKTVKEATDSNSKSMAAITKALLESGVALRDIQTSRFSVQPVYAPQEPRTEPKLAGYSVSNQVRVKIRQIDTVGEVLDHLVTAGVTDIGNVEFLVSEPSKALDQAREAAIADARRKAEVYAHASGIQLGRVEWITEDSGFALPVPTRAQGASAAMAAPVPIASGEDTLRVRVTVGFDIAR
jgi:uncharacterized protein